VTVHAKSHQAHNIIKQKISVESHGCEHGCVNQVAIDFQLFWASKKDSAHVAGGQVKGHQAIGEHVEIHVL